MKKKWFGLFISIAVFSVLCGFLISAALEEVQGNLEESAEKITETSDSISSGDTSYLAQEWSKILLKNPVVSTADSFFNSISIVFEILFGMPYSFSAALFFVIIIWIYFFLKINEMMKYLSTFSSATGLLISLGAVIFLAQLSFFEMVYKFFRWLVLLTNSLAGQIVIFFAILILLAIIYKITTDFGINFKKGKEDLEKAKEKIDRGVLNYFVQTFKEAFK